MDTLEDHDSTDVSVYLAIIENLKELIVNCGDENTIESMKSVLEEVPTGKIFSFVTPSQSFNFLGSGEPTVKSSNSYFSGAPQAPPRQGSNCPLPPPPGLTTSSGGLPPLAPPIMIPVTPLSSTSSTSLHSIPQQPITSHTCKPPIIRRHISQTNMDALISSMGLAAPAIMPTLPSSGKLIPTTPSPKPPSANAGFDRMRRSPSMPEFDKPNDAPKPSIPTPSSFTKGSVTINASNLKNSKDDLTLPKKAATVVRQPLVKSVSMGAIQTEKPIPNTTSLEEISGQIYHLTKYQAGCRFLQNKLDENPKPENVAIIFKEVYEHLVELMTDPYGQYLIPQLMKYCDENQRNLVVERIASQVATFACHNYGIHGIQKLLVYLNPKQLEPIIESISDKIVMLVKDVKGNYLIQTFLKTFSPEINQFIYDGVMDNIGDIASDKVGCTVINKCLDYASHQQLTCLVQVITDNSLQLVQDQFGNYVVQHILKGNPGYSSDLIQSLSGYIAELSIQKHSSNVIEKCLHVADLDTYEIIIDELTNGDIVTLLQDKYANFVIQTALDVANEAQHTRLVKLIVPYIHIVKTPYVIHIQKKILQL
eukprot:gene3591-4111_t